jgi:hypothetical protein
MLFGCRFDAGGLGTPPAPDAVRIVAADAARPADARADAAPDARPDAAPDAPTCGDVGEACCPAHGDSPACVDGAECTGGMCTACGGPFQSCCDPGATCRLGLCVGGGCVSLSR